MGLAAFNRMRQMEAMKPENLAKEVKIEELKTAQIEDKPLEQKIKENQPVAQAIEESIKEKQEEPKEETSRRSRRRNHTEE